MGGALILPLGKRTCLNFRASLRRFWKNKANQILNLDLKEPFWAQYPVRGVEWNFEDFVETCENIREISRVCMELVKCYGVVWSFAVRSHT